MEDQIQRERRSTFLVIATAFANFYLIAFGLDAALSLADEVLKAAGSSPLGDFRQVVANIVVLATVVMFILIIFVPQLPKLVFLPLILFVVWAVFGAVPFDLTQQSTVFSLAVLQVVVIASVLLINKLRTSNWLMSAQLLPHKSHLVLRTIVSFVVLGLLLPIAGFSLLLVGFASMIEKQTGGYLQFSSSGIEVRETILTRETKTVRLIGMVHVGEPAFYETLYASFPVKGLVLAEGVTDRERRLAGGFSYKGLAEVMGLRVQPQLGAPPEGTRPPPGPGKPAPRPSSSAPASSGPISIPATADRPRIIYADADVSDFSPKTVLFLGKVGELYASTSFNELLERLNKIGEEFTEQDLTGVFDDILHKRNARILAEFDKRVGEYDAIIIPWGAQHMPGLEAELLKRGFRIQSQRMLAVARYQTIIDRLARVIQGPQSKTSFSYRQRKWIG